MSGLNLKRVTIQTPPFLWLFLPLQKGTNNPAKSDHVSSPFLIFMFCFIYIFQLALISLNLWSFSAPLDPNPITDLDNFVNRLREKDHVIDNDWWLWKQVELHHCIWNQATSPHQAWWRMEKNGIGAQTWGRCHG